MLLTKIILILIFFLMSGWVNAFTYSSKLCKETQHYRCYITQKGDTWESLFPDATERETIKKINRRGNELVKGIKVAIPLELSYHPFAYAPFVHQIPPPNVKTILISLNHLAWAAYDPQGNLIRWGKISGGRTYCSDTK